MSEVFFYHLTQTPLEVALPKILERAHNIRTWFKHRDVEADIGRAAGIVCVNCVHGSS